MAKPDPHRMTPERFQQLARLPADTRSGPERELWEALVAERMGESELARLERDLAEDNAETILDSFSEAAPHGWHAKPNLGDCDAEKQDWNAAARYLDLRDLLERHPDNPDWVRVKAL